MASTGSQSQNVCALCLESTVARGGVPLTCPGCCGKWFHQKCLNDVIKKGNGLCPCCRAPLPRTTTSSSVTPVQNVQQQQQQQQHAPQRSPSFMSRIGNVFSFGRSSNSNSNSNNATPFQVQQQLQPALMGSHPLSQRGMEETDDDFTEDPLPEANPSQADATDSSESKMNVEDEGESNAVGMELSGTPEYTTIGTERVDAFHTIASIRIKDDPNLYKNRKGMDIVCVLDKSGSMSGAKFTFLKHAMRFVQSQLGENDRLSLLTFNSQAICVHGLKCMDTNGRSESESKLNSLSSFGGTNIYAGMKKGYQVLNRRTRANTISCMMLLTDGVDNSNREEKLALARQMKAEGIGMYVFAFGADHNSEHLNAIASAAESSYVYVEDNDQVIDAFGGALGSQQGLAAKNIVMKVDMVEDGVVVDEVNAGEYRVDIAAGSRSASISFSNLFAGETRDVLVRLRVPASSAIPQYPLFKVSASYTPLGAEQSMNSSEEENAQCVVERVAGPHKNSPSTRNIEVDAQVWRLKVTELLKQTMDMADQGKMSEARKALQDCAAELGQTSVSFAAKHPIPTQLATDLGSAISAMVNREQYSSRGGRSMMTEAYSSNVQQRSCMSKGATPSYYQSSSSSAMETQSKAYKKSLF